MKNKTNTIAVQGFGYVGAVNAVNVALSKELSEYNVLCFEKKNKRTLDIIKNAEKGHFPYNTNDQTLIKNFKNLVRKKKINFTFDSKDYQKTKIIIITINYDFKNIKKNKYNFLNSFQEIISNARTNSLIILETTVPPGTTEYLLKPMLDKIKKKKNTIFIYLMHLKG